jgi:NADPH-dependent 2,4-dienoyl-CoA reductase/sulfur reductase-like enzyme/nitrite reductase/ring-hydroxylating ferredoxin subunit
MPQNHAPDFRKGYPLQAIVEGTMVAGRVGDEAALLIRRGQDIFAIGAACTHYHASLSDGLLVEDTVRCPMHHACFSLRTGEALYAPALDPLDTWRIEVVSDRAYAREKNVPLSRVNSVSPARASSGPRSVVIIGGGAAALAAADMLRRESYTRPVTLLSADEVAPYDRPNVSKDFLAGTAPEEWMPLRSASYYSDQRIDLQLKQRVTSINTAARVAHLADGRQFAYGALLLATGADPIHLPVPAAPGARIFYLRTLADGRALVAAAASARTALVVGASFIGLEAAASLRARGLNVHVVGLESVPLVRVLGPEVGAFVQKLHESKGVIFHLGQSVTRADAHEAILSDGSILPADIVVMGVGVKPALALAEQAGLSIDRGVITNEFLETSAPGVFAAGDIARWPDPHSGERIRVEHWAVAQRQGQIAARNMLGARERCAIVPFFWSQHYEVAINYVGHAEQWDVAVLDGSLESHDCAISYRRGERTLAVATISRDLQSLRAEHLFEAMK